MYKNILQAQSVSEAVVSFYFTFFFAVLIKPFNLFKALPDHGVYTVFINLGNTKIEVLHFFF